MRGKCRDGCFAMQDSRKKPQLVSRKSQSEYLKFASSCGNQPDCICLDQGNRIRPGALLAPVCVWQLLQSPDVCIAAMTRSRPMYVTFAR